MTNAERCKDYYYRNQEKRNASSMAYYNRNKEEIKRKRNAKNQAESANGRTAHVKRMERAYKSPEAYVKFLHDKIRKSAKDRNKMFSLTLEDITNKIVESGGKCEISGIPLTIKPSMPNTVSIDRIDSSKGYIKSNIRICSVQANVSKHTMTDKQFVEFCEGVLKYNGYKVNK